MKKKILEELKTKFVGVSENILDRVADKLAKTITTEEEVATAVEGVTFQSILESYGDSRATEAQKTAVSNYEKKHGLKDGQHIDKTVEPTNPKKDKKDDDDVPAWAKALIESNKALNDKIASIEGDKTATNRKSTLNKILSNAPETIRSRYEKDFSRMSFADDDDFNAWIGEITPDVEKITTDFKGAVVRRPKTGGGSGSEENPYLKARIAEREAVKTAPAIIGLQETK